MRRLATLGLVLLLALAAAACERDGAAGDFAAAFRDVTNDYEAQLGALGGLDADADREALLEAYRGLREIAADARARYAALEPPDDLAPGVEALVDNLDEQVGLLDDLVDAAAADDADAVALHLADLAGLVAEWGQTAGLVLERLPE